MQSWVIILYCLLIFQLYAGVVNSGSDMTTPIITEEFGILPGTILNIGTTAGAVDVAFFVVVGQINRVVGARITSGMCLIVTGPAYLGVGSVVNLAMYTARMYIVVGGVMSTGCIPDGDLVTRWFPKEENVITGYTTMGHGLASIAFIPLITLLVGRLGIDNGIIPISIYVVVLGIFGLFLVRSTPQGCGLSPGNMSDGVYRTEYFRGYEDFTGGWATGRLLRCGEAWLVAVTTGMLQICSLDVVSQIVLRSMELSFSREQAAFILGLVALIDLVGPFFVGCMDGRLDIRKSMLFFGIWYTLSLLANAIENAVLVYISIFTIGMPVDDSTDFTASLTTSVFGRRGFNRVNSVVFPVQGTVSALPFVISGIVSSIIGGDPRYAYLIFTGASVVPALIVLLMDEHCFNKDWRQEQNACFAFW